MRMSHLKRLSSDFSKNPFSNSVIIIDEAHNFVSRIVNKLNNTSTELSIAQDSLSKTHKLYIKEIKRQNKIEIEDLARKHKLEVEDLKREFKHINFFEYFFLILSK